MIIKQIILFVIFIFFELPRDADHSVAYDTLSKDSEKPFWHLFWGDLGCGICWKISVNLVFR